MVSRTALLLLAFTVSQVFATSPLRQRSIELLESRQLACDSECDSFSNLITACTGSDLTCLCNAAAASMLQGCITCAVTVTTGGAPDANVTESAQKLITTYTNECARVAGVPAVTIPGTSGSTNTRASSLSTTLPLTSTSIRRSTVTSGSTTPIVAQSTFSKPGSSSTEDTLPTNTNGLPAGIVSNDGRQSYNGMQAGLFAIGGMLGVALVL